MKFSDTTNKTGIIQQIEYLTGVGDAGISGNATLLKQITAMVNRSYRKVVAAVLSSQDDWDFDDSNLTDLPVYTRAMTTNRDYPLPPCFKVKRLDVTYDNTNWYHATPIDSSSLPNGLGGTAIDDEFATTSPAYDIVGNSILLYPKGTASGTLRIEVIRDVDEFTSSDTTQEPGVDKMWHPLISYYASLEYCLANGLDGKAKSIKVLADEDEVRMKQYYGKKATDAPLIATSNYVNYN